MVLPQVWLLSLVWSQHLAFLPSPAPTAPPSSSCKAGAGGRKVYGHVHIRKTLSCSWWSATHHWCVCACVCVISHIIPVLQRLAVTRVGMAVILTPVLVFMVFFVFCFWFWFFFPVLIFPSRVRFNTPLRDARRPIRRFSFSSIVAFFNFYFAHARRALFCSLDGLFRRSLQ